MVFAALPQTLRTVSATHQKMLLRAELPNVAFCSLPRKRKWQVAFWDRKWPRTSGRCTLQYLKLIHFHSYSSNGKKWWVCLCLSLLGSTTSVPGLLHTETAVTFLKVGSLGLPLPPYIWTHGPITSVVSANFTMFQFHQSVVHQQAPGVSGKRLHEGLERTRQTPRLNPIKHLCRNLKMSMNYWSLSNLTRLGGFAHKNVRIAWKPGK